jgi:DNA-directed RNA polymerase specialized sigma24 family protein
MDEREHQQQIAPEILRLVCFKSVQLAGKYGFAFHDAEDIQQELLLDYFQRSRHFNAHRCSRRGFARLVVNHRVAALIEAQRAVCRDYRATRSSIDQALSDSSPQADRTQLEIAPSAKTEEAQMNLRLDVERTLSRLPAGLLYICRLVMVCDSMAQVATRAGMSRATLYRRLQEVRAVFVESDLGSSRRAV